MGVPIPLEDFDDDFDPFTGLLTTGGEGHVTEIHPELARLRRQASVHELDLSVHFGAEKFLFIADTPVYAVLGYKEVNEILTDVDRFSNRVHESGLGRTFGRSVTVMDPPEHTRYRKLFQAAFTPKMLDSLRDKFQTVIDRLMAKFINRGEVDLVQEFALHFPFQFIMDLMGMPEEQRPLFHKIAIAQTCMMFDMDHAVEASRKLGVYLDQLINDRRENGADDDFVAVMARAEAEGERLPQIVLISFFRQLMNAGGDTSYHGFSNILTALFTHPDQLDAVRKDRGLIRQAIEEGLRWNGPILAIQREPKADVEIGGVTIPKGAYINVAIGSANRDESVWETPDKFDIFRTAISFPTDSKLLNRSRVRLVRLARRHGIELRQSYARKGPEALLKANRYAHARQLRRMRREVKRLKTYLGRVVRDIERKLAGNAEMQTLFADELAKAKRLLAQKKTDKNKLYSLHAPEVECLAKGKAHKRYEFGVKASIATTNKSNFVVGGMALPGNPFDGHTLVNALGQVRRLCGNVIEEVFVDRGYRGHGEQQSTVYISGQRRGIKTQRLKRSLKRRQAIEPVIGHLKSDGLLDRNYLKGTEGDQMNVLLSCAGHNLRLILKQLRIFYRRFFGTANGIRALIAELAYQWASLLRRHSADSRSSIQFSTMKIAECAV